MHADHDPQSLMKIDSELSRLAKHLLGDTDEADDARQDTWLAAAQGSADRAPSFVGWLSVALRFRGLRNRRGLERRSHHERMAATKRLEAASPSETLERDEVRLKLLEAVSALDVVYRRTITLSFFDGLPPRTVARVMSVPVATVRTRRRRGLEQLRERLDSEFGEREAWALPLAPPALWLSEPAVSAANSFSEFTQGAILMSSKAKIGVTTVLIVALAGAAFYFNAESAEKDLESRSQAKTEAPTSARRQSSIQESAPQLADSSVAEETAEEAVGPVDPDAIVSAPTTGSLELQVIFAEDGKAAADVPLQLLPFGVANPFFHEEVFRTDKTGRLVLESWPAGTSLARPFVGGSKRLKIKAGEVTQETLAIPQGTRITGVVETEDGAPVAGADIVTGKLGDAIHAIPLTRSGIDGRFVVPNFYTDDFEVIGARMAGILPSPMVLLFASRGDERDLKLVLGGPAGKVILKVLDADENPVEKARCLVGTSSTKLIRMEDGSDAMELAATDGLTDEDGMLVLESVPPGKTALIVRARGLAPVTTSINVFAGATTRHRVLLQLGGRVSGTITGDDGLPLQGAEVTLGDYGSMDGHYMRTDQEGKFRFENVGLGETKIQAEKSKSGHAKETIFVALHEETIWDQQLIKGDSIVGVVLDENANPIQGLEVVASATSNEGKYSGGISRTDPDGRFKLVDLDARRTYRLRVRGSDGWTILKSIEGVKTGSELLKIQVPTDSIGLASFKGRIVGPDNQPISGVSISARRLPRVSGSGPGAVTTDDEGRFVFPKVAPGRYTFGFGAPGLGHWRSEEFVIVAGQTLDVGDLRFGATGRLSVTLSGDHFVKDLDVHAMTLDGSTTVAVRLGGTSTLSQPIAAGLYRMKLVGKKTAERSCEVEIFGGRTSNVTFEVKEGRQMSFLVVGGQGDVSYRLLDSAGSVLTAGKGRQQSRDGDHLFQLRVAGGDHRLELEDSSGKKGSLSLASDTPSGMTLNLE